jgi:hypothetical protein
MVRLAPASASVLATIPWAPAGLLPRRLEPVRMSSVARPGPALLRSAASRVRTLADGAVCVLSAPDEDSGHCAALRLDAGGLRDPVWIGSEDGSPGWQIVDFLAAADGHWTVLERVPGPPDRVQVRRLDAAGATVWRAAATAGSPKALRQLVEGADSVLAVTDGAPRRLVAIAADGTISDVQSLADADGECFANGRGALGFVGFDPGTGARSWVSVDIGDDTRRPVGLAAEDASILDVPLGMDAHGRPYGSRYATLARLDAAGHIDWQLEVAQAVVEDGGVWIAPPPQPDRGLVAIWLGSPEQVSPMLDPGTPGVWRLAGLSGRDAFVLHECSDPAQAGTLATLAADGSLLDTTPAPDDVWLRWFDLQRPRGPTVTAAGEIDVATRGPHGLHIVRVTPSA